jgi:flagellar protein FlaG
VKPSGNSKTGLPEIRLPSGGMEATAPKPSTKEMVAPPERLSLTEIAKILSRVNLRFDLFEIQANFSIDEARGGIQIEVVNNKTGEVIRRIPPYEAVALFSEMGKVAGLLLDQRV